MLKVFSADAIKVRRLATVFHFLYFLERRKGESTTKNEEIFPVLEEIVIVLGESVPAHSITKR